MDTVTAKGKFDLGDRGPDSAAPALSFLARK